MANDDGRNFASIPGTLVYGGELARSGHALNKMCRSLIDAAARERFARDPQAYMEQYGLSPAQQQAVMKRDWAALQALGGNVYYLAKLAGVFGVTVQGMSAAMANMSLEAFERMLAAGGRKPNG